MISPEKRQALEEKMRRLNIKEEDLIEKFILGSGRGGQKINKTSSCVYLKHLPSGMEIKCQKERSREMNRYYARKELCERLERHNEGQRSAKEQEIAKLRRQKRRRSRRSKEKMLQAKKHLSEVKSLRKEVKE